MSSHAISRPQDVLPDDLDRTEIDGIVMRKGTVAAFVRNAIRWSDPETSEADRAALTEAIIEAVPALRALGVLTVFQLRDERLRALVDTAGQAVLPEDGESSARLR